MDSRVPVDVCVVTYNRSDQVVRAIQSCYEQTWPIGEIIVVDNNSNDGTVSSIEGRFPDVLILKMHVNLGCPPARNIAMANSRAEFLINLDDDGEFAPDAIESAMEAMGRFPEAGVVMMDIVEDGESRHPAWTDGQLLPVFSGGCSLFRRSILDECGYYDDKIFRQGEEYDLSIRLFEKDWEIRFSKTAKMFHYPPLDSKSDLNYMCMGAISRSLSLIKFAPMRWIAWDLPRRVMGYSALFLSRGRIDLVIRLWSGILGGVRGALGGRKVHAKGYQMSRNLHSAYNSRS